MQLLFARMQVKHTVTTNVTSCVHWRHEVTFVAPPVSPSVANLSVGRRGRGGGSGVVITPDGFLLTSAHVVANGSSRIRASFTDGRELGLRLVGADALSDLAVLRADGPGPAAP